MLKIDIQSFFNSLTSDIMSGLEFYGPKTIGAIMIILIGFWISIAVYKVIIRLFKKFNIIQLIDKLNIEVKEKNSKAEDDEERIIKRKKISDRIKIDEIVAKALSYYIFLIFFRFAIQAIGINEVEDFLGELIAYIPSLFIAVVIGFFWVRFANFIYDVVYHALDLTKQKTAKIIASGAKIIILFFTLMAVLSKIGIAEQITQTILTGFIWMLALAWGLAFWLWGKEVAREILESFRK